MQRAAERLLTWLATAFALIGGGGLAAAVLTTCFSAMGKGLSRILKSTFGADAIPANLAWIKPINGEDELVAFAIGFALFAAAPYVMLKRGHVTIDLFERFFGPTLNRILTLAGDLLFAALAWMLFSQQWNLIFKPARTSRGQDPLVDLVAVGDWAQITKRFQNSQETQVLGLEYWPMHIWAEVCTALFLIVALFCVTGSAQALFAPTRASSSNAP